MTSEETTIPPFWSESPFREFKTDLHNSPISKLYEKDFRRKIHGKSMNEILGEFEINETHIDSLLDCLRDKKNKLKGAAESALEILTRLAVHFSMEQVYDFLPILNFIDIYCEENPNDSGFWEERFEGIFLRLGKKVISPLCTYLVERFEVKKKGKSRFHVLYFLERVVFEAGDTNSYEKVTRCIKSIFSVQSKKETNVMNAGYANLVKNLRLSGCMKGLRTLYEKGQVINTDNTSNFEEISYDEVLLHVCGANAVRKELVEGNELIRMCHHCDDPICICERTRERETEAICKKSWERAQDLYPDFLEHDLESHETESLILYLDDVISTFEHDMRTVDVRIRDVYDMRSRCFFSLKKFSLSLFDYLMVKFFKIGNTQMKKTPKDSRLLDLETMYDNQVKEVFSRTKNLIPKSTASKLDFKERKIVRRAKYKVRYDKSSKYHPPSDFDPSSYRYYHCKMDGSLEMLDISSGERMETRITETTTTTRKRERDERLRSIQCIKGGRVFSLGMDDERVREYTRDLKLVNSFRTNHYVKAEKVVIRTEEPLMVITKAYKGEVRVWQFLKDRNEYVFAQRITGMRRVDEMVVNKNYLLMTGNNSQCRCYDLDKMKILRTYIPGRCYENFGVSSFFLAANDNFVVVTYEDYTVAIFHFESGSQIHRIQVSASASSEEKGGTGTNKFFVQQLEMFSKSDLFAISFPTGQIRVFDCVTGTCCVTMDETHGHVPFRLRFVKVKTGDVLLKSASLDNTIVFTRFTIKKCQVCGVRADKVEKFCVCSRCKNVYYCGRNCQMEDWKKGHSKKCKKKKKGKNKMKK